MRFACAKQGTGQLRYVARAGDCRTSKERLVRFRDAGPVIACAHRGGFVYRVANRAACKSKKHRPSLMLVLPDDVRKWFCADKQSGKLRSTQHAPYGRPRPPRLGASACRGDERRVFVEEGNRRPHAVSDSATVDEDHAASIRVLDNDTDPEGDALEVASVNPGGAKGSIAIAADRRSVSYDPNGRFEALGSGASATETFTYRATDGQLGNSAAVTVTVTGVNDGPRAVADAGSTNEDAATTIAVLANDSDPDQGDALSVTAVDTTSTAGEVAINPDGTVRYDPAGQLDELRAGDERVDRFAYTASDGHGGTAGGTVSVSVAGVNDSPVVSSSAGTAAYTEGDLVATTVDSGLTVGDPDDTELEGATVRIVSGFEAGDELSVANPGGITVNGEGTGVLTLTGAASVANYQAALRSVKYIHTGDNPAPVKTVEFRADDGDGLGPAATRDIQVTEINDPPAISTSVGAVGYTEGDAATPVDPGLLLTDPDSTQISGATVQITGNYANPEDVLALPMRPNIAGAYNAASGTLTLTGTDTVANYQAALRAVTYRNVSNSPSTAPRTATFVASDASSSSSPATRNVNVSATDNAPDVDNSPGSLAYTENDAATAIDTAITITDPDSVNLTGATVQITGNYVSGEDVLALPAQPVVTAIFDVPTGRLTLSGTAPVGAYEAALEAVTYVNSSDVPSTAPRTVTYAARDIGGFGLSDTHGITIAAVDDLPLAVDDSSTVAEDAGASAIGVLANDTDVDGGPKSVASASDPANGTVVVTGGGTGLTYQPDANYCNDPPGTSPDTFTYTLNGGDSATVSVIVTCVDDAPTAVDDSATVGEDSGAGAIDVLANDTDTDSGPKTIVSAGDPANGTVIVTGGGTGLTYEPDPNYCNDPPGTSPDTFTYTLNGGDSATVSVTVTCVDDTPIAVNDTATVVEDSGASAIDVLANDTDGDGGPKAIASASDPANGTVVLSGGSPGAHTDLTYQPDPNYCNNHAGGTSDDFTYTLNGGSTATVAVTVDCTPDDPSVDTSAGTTSYTENDPATPIDSGVTVTDPDPGTTITGATIQITSGFAGPEDILALASPGSHPGITPSLSVSGDTLTLTGPASPAAFQAALRDVTYRNSSDAPSTAARTVTFTVTDETSRTGSDTKGITVVATDDPPTAVSDSATVLEDASATAIPVLTNDTDVDGGPKTISSASDPANGTVVLTGGSPGAHTGLTYQPDPNYCNDPPGTTPDTFTYTLNGGSTATVSLTVTCVNDAPVADDETFSGANGSIGNTALIVNDPDDGAPSPSHPKKTIGGDILSGDTDIDGPGPLTVTPGTFATNDGGSVTIESDGDFTFHPAAGTSCTDTSDFFDYTVEDSGSPELTDTGRVTIAIAGCVWYVSNNAAGNSGTSSAPFDTLAQAESASGANHTVFVFDGDNTSTGLGGDGYAMNSGERLIGEHEGLQVDPDGGGALGSETLHPANPGAHPTLTATNADVIDLDDGNEVRGFNIDPEGTGGGIAGASGDTGGGTIDDVNIVDNGTAGTQPGLELDATTGTFNVSNLVVDNDATGVRLNNAGTVNFDSTGTISITSAGAKGLDAIGTNLGSGSVFDAITVTGSGTGGVSMATTTGTTTFGDLAVTTTSGATPAFNLATAGTVTVSAAGTANISATGGPAVDVTGTTGATLPFDAVSSTNSAGDGINLSGLGSGTFSATSGTIAGAAGISFDLDGGSGTVTYPGALNNGAGQTAEITNRGGGAVTLSGAISDTSDAGGGINLAGNTGGSSTTFSNSSKTINTGAGNAIVMSGSDGHTLTLSGGGLDIDATSGAGIDASTSGTLIVTGTGNTINTGTGRALNVSATDIGTGGLNFQTVTSNGAPNGINLNTTGSTAGLTVTGNGGSCTSAATCTGGAIQNATGAGIDLTSVGGGVSLTRMSVNNGGDDGVRGSSVAGLNLTNLNVAANGNAVGESGIELAQLTGSGSMATTTVSGSADRNVHIANTSGTLSAFGVTGSSFTTTNATTGDDGFIIENNGTGSMAVSVTGSTFTDNKGDHFNAATDASATGSLAVTFSSNTLTTTAGNDPNVIGGGITITPSGSADLTFTIDNNNVQQAFDEAINLNLGTASTAAASLIGTISNNIVGTAADVDSGSESGTGINVTSNGAGTTTVAVTGNQVRQYANPYGILLNHKEGSSTMNATVTGNTVANPGTFAINGIRADSGATTGDSGTMCVAATGNSVAGSGPGVDTDIRLRQRFNTTIRLPGYGGANSDATAVNSFVAGNNPGADVSSVNNVGGGGGGFIGGAACTTP
jgi:VCBS repeat-containing protein